MEAQTLTWKVKYFFDEKKTKTNYMMMNYWSIK